MGDLDEACLIAAAHVGHLAAEQVEIGLDRGIGISGPGGDNGELARLDHLGVAGHRGGEHRGAEGGRLLGERL